MSKAIADFFTNNFQKLKRYLLYSFRDLGEEDAEDIIQQTALKLLEGGYTNRIDFISSYVYKSLLNGARDYLRRGVRIDYRTDIEPVDENTAEDLLLNDELGEKIKDALYKLDEKSRFVFMETQIKGRSYEELAQETGEPLGTLLSRKSRAKEKLRNILKNYIE